MSSPSRRMEEYAAPKHWASIRSAAAVCDGTAMPTSWSDRNRRSSRLRFRRHGVVLFEALVAIAILGTIASAAAWKTAETLHAVRRTHAREAEVRAAQRLLSAVYLWPREDLDRHLGSRSQDRWTMRVDRVTGTLYEIALIDTVSAGVVLRTTVFRELEQRQ